MADMTIKQMFGCGVHFGHRKRYWHPKMKPYIYGISNGVHIINLEITIVKFKEALNFISQIVRQGGDILFVGTKRSANEAIKTHAERCGMPYVNYRWLGGMLTNYNTIKSSISRLDFLEYEDKEGFKKYTKKEALTFSKEMIKKKTQLRWYSKNGKNT